MLSQKFQHSLYISGSNCKNGTHKKGDQELLQAKRFSLFLKQVQKSFWSRSD